MEVTYWVGDVSCYEESEGNIQDGWITVSVNGGIPFSFGPDEVENTEDDETYYTFNWEGPLGFEAETQNIYDFL